jgi:metal-responsive CopG/Arc/MetJ family transcriptional regulator
MSSVKTAISLDQSLFKETNRTARLLRIPRSRVIAMALEEFLHRRRNRETTEQLNRVYANGPDPESQRVVEAMSETLAKRLKGTW